MLDEQRGSTVAAVAANDATTLGRGLALLRALGGDEAAARGGLGVVEVARLVGREKSQVSRALRTLADLGFVDRDPDSLDYRLGWQMFALAARAGEGRLLAAAAPVLGDLVAALGETAHLSVLDGTEVLTVLSEASPRAVRVDDATGGRVPAHCTSSGQALLLDHDRAALAARFGAGALERCGPRAPRDLDQLHRRIEAARAAGHALSDEEFEPGLVAAAAPVRDFRGRIAAALNVSGPKFRFEAHMEAAGHEVQRAAAALSQRLGWNATAGRST